ncbi:ADP%2C ATP carrier protein [Chlamydia trachomatis]|nr:ADP%2C ATP carrier protein [Chlamydia trachomatis]
MVWLTSATKLNKLFLAASAAKEQELAEAAAAEKEASSAAKESAPAIEGVS